MGKTCQSCSPLHCGDGQEGAFTNVVMVSFEDSLLLVLLLTVFFIFPIFTLKVIIALELLPHTNLPPGKIPISCCAHQFLLVTVSFTPGCGLVFAASIQALLTRMYALTWCFTSASVPPPLVTVLAAFVLPKCLVVTELRISGLPSCGFVLELLAVVGSPIVIAPSCQQEAVAPTIIYIAGS